MKSASISETKNRLSALIDLVRHGDTVVITDRGRPVARLASLAADPAEAKNGRLARLEREGVVRRGLVAPPAAEILRPPPAPRGGASVVDALLDERSEGR